MEKEPTVEPEAPKVSPESLQTGLLNLAMALSDSLQAKGATREQSCRIVGGYLGSLAEQFQSIK